MSKCQQIGYLIDLLTVEVVSVERTGIVGIGSKAFT
jgi:hypothetical protein